MKTIVIDDDTTARTLITRSLEGLGYWVIQSSNGRHAWETLWENRDTALLVTDMLMPDMDGGELTQLIRGNTMFENLPIVIMSGVLEPSDIQPFLRFPRCAFLPKPIDLMRFEEVVRELMADTR